MFRKLTTGASLNPLRAFEAMARTGRATAAGEELGVTHSAVSRQVRALERRLGARLFGGPRHALALTPAGRELAAALSPAFDAIAAAVRQARGGAAGVVVAAHASLASKWLIPRLAGFAKEHPDTPATVLELASDATADRDADLALRLVGPEGLDRSGVMRLAPNLIGPVASPALETPMTAPRLFSRTHPRGWSDWAAATGEVEPATPSIAFAHLHLALEAAVGGMGVAVLPWVLVAGDVAAGRLVQVGPFVEDGGWLVSLSALSDPPRQVRLFNRWLAEQAQSAARPE